MRLTCRRHGRRIHGASLSLSAATSDCIIVASHAVTRTCVLTAITLTAAAADAATATAGGAGAAAAPSTAAASSTVAGTGGANTISGGCSGVSLLSCAST
jgi:hypothetical protein